MGNNTWIDENGQIHREHSNQHEEPLGKYPPKIGCEENNEIKSIMKRYPELKLAPTSLVCRPGLVGWWFLYIFIFFVIGFWLFPGILAIDDGDETLGIIIIFVSVAMAVFWGVIFYKKILRHPHGGHKKLVKEADYVSGNRGLCIFVKNNRFGLMKLWGCKVYVPPVYDYMEWEAPNKLLRVKKDGRTFLIDIYNNEV